MTNSRIIALATLLLTATNVALVASQANSQPQSQAQSQPTSLFYERQTQVTSLSGQTTATATATLSAIAQAQADSHTSDNSTSSATTAYAHATNSQSDMSDLELKQIQAYRAQQENIQEQEMKVNISQSAYNNVWLSKPSPTQEKLAKEIATVLPEFPRELIRLIAQYEYEFKGLLRETIKKSHNKKVTVLAAFPNGSFVSGALDGTIKVWSPIKNQNGQTTWKDSFVDEHVRTIVALVILPDIVFASSSSFASASLDGSIHFSKLLPYGEAAWQGLGQLFSHEDIYGLIALADGSLISAGFDHINFWPFQGERWKKESIIDESDSDLAGTELAALSDNSFASGHRNSKIKIWLRSTSFQDPKNWYCVQTIKGDKNDKQDIRSLTVLSDSSLVAGCEGGQIKIFVPTLDSRKKVTWKKIQTLKVSNTATIATWVGSLAVLPNNSFVSGADGDSSIRVWSYCPENNKPSCFAWLWSFFSKPWKCTKTLPVLTYWNAPLAVLPDGSLVSGAENSISIWS